MRPASRERRNFASGKRKRFWRVSRGGGERKSAILGNDSGRKPQTAAWVRDGRSARTKPATATHLLAKQWTTIGGRGGAVRCRIKGSSMRHAPLGRRVNAAFRVN